MKTRHPRTSLRLLIHSAFFFLFTILSFFARSQDFSKLDAVLSSLYKGSARFMVPERFSILPEKRLIAARPGSRSEERVHCFIYTTKGRELKDSGFVIESILPGVVTAWATMAELTRLTMFDKVSKITAPRFDHLHNDVPRGNSGAAQLQQGALNNTPYTGKGVIVAIYDTGIDWDHPDFRDAGDQSQSRILRIWDQTLSPVAGEHSPAGFAYGVEYTQADINDELGDSPSGKVRERDINGHGTHVAGTAAGNGAALGSRKYRGMAPDADIVVIKGGNGSFSQANTVDAALYCQQLSIALGRPVVINASLGGQDGPHDGTLPHEQAFNQFTSSGPGRVAVISAGNDNGIAIHKQLSLPVNGSGVYQFNISSNTAAADMMQFNIYCSDNLPINAIVTAPSGETLASANNTITTATVISNGMRVYIDNEINPDNGQRFVTVVVQRESAGLDMGGAWTITLNNPRAVVRRADGYLVYLNGALTKPALVAGDNNYLVGSPGNASNVITVASYVGQVGWYSNAGTPGGWNYGPPTQHDNLSTFSSFGPRRDAVQKPDIAAQGQAVISCLSSDDPLPADNSSVVIPGFYRVDQGTSMASPVVAGCVALLLQVKPGATFAEVKSAINSTADHDALTAIPGPTPNAGWGYGKINAFRAAAALTACPSSDRKTYRYDNSATAAQDAPVNLAGARVAVRFTPDISGELGGVSFSTVTPQQAGGTFNLTSLKVEVRAKSGINPGALLATADIPPVNVALFSWNYFDLDTLHVPVTAGTDYFIVLVPGAGSTWGLRADAVNNDGRTLTSTDGISWASQNFDCRVRSTVYSSNSSTAFLATTTSAKSNLISSSYQFYNAACELMTQVEPAGAAPVTGNVQAKVTVSSGPQTTGALLYVGRYYDLQPANDATLATTKLQLYFTQAEFNAFNAASGSTTDLPTGPADAAGIANLRVSHYKGTSASGLPGTYNGDGELIDPVDADIRWNATRSRWEIGFGETGNGGFFIQTALTVLPISIEYFRGTVAGKENVLNWKVNCEGTPTVLFAIERSADGADFKHIGLLTAVERDCLRDFNFTDQKPLPGANYYRIRITEQSGQVYYTNIILLRSEQQLIASVNPSVLKKDDALVITFPGANGMFTVTDALGRVIFNGAVYRGVQQVQVPFRSAGIYYYRLSQPGKQVINGKLVVQ